MDQHHILEAVLGVTILDMCEVKHKGIVMPEPTPKLAALFDISFRIEQLLNQEFPSEARFQEARLHPIMVYTTEYMYGQWCEYRGFFSQVRSFDEWQQIIESMRDEPQ